MIGKTLQNPLFVRICILKKVCNISLLGLDPAGPRWRDGVFEAATELKENLLRFFLGSEFTGFFGF